MPTPRPHRYEIDSQKLVPPLRPLGLMLPAISLGCWHNFGGAGTDSARHADEAGFHDNARKMLFTAFDLGITHFDLANNYGPPPAVPRNASAESSRMTGRLSR